MTVSVFSTKKHTHTHTHTAKFLAKFINPTFTETKQVAWRSYAQTHISHHQQIQQTGNEPLWST